VLQATAHALRSLAQRALWAQAEIAVHERAMLEHVRALCHQLLDEPGVGTVTAAEFLVGFSHPGRLHGEAAFARLGGVAPLEASSGQVERHRLDRGGDRRINHALHTVVLTRQRCDEDTKRYLERRMGEGKSKREAVRCLKRYIARHLFRLMEVTVVGG
jgi:transposase